MLWTNFWTSFSLFLAIFRCLNKWKSASAKILIQISEDQRFGCENTKNSSFCRRRKHENAICQLSETVLRTFAHRPPKLGQELWVSVIEEEFRRPSSELSHTVLRNLAESCWFQWMKENFGDRPPKFRTTSCETSRSHAFHVFHFFRDFFAFFWLMPRVHPS